MGRPPSRRRTGALAGETATESPALPSPLARPHHWHRRHAAGLPDTATEPSRRTISFDGKTLKQSFDNFNDRTAAQVLHAFNLAAGLVLAHIEIDETSNEIPAAQRLLGEPRLANCTVTLDAMHCQNKPSRPPQRRRRTSSCN